MKKKFLIPIFAVILLSGCAHEFNQVYKSQNYAYKYEYAKECFARGKYAQAITLLQELVTIQKGTDNAEESLYMLAMAQYNDMDYEGAAMTFKKYRQTYPKGIYAEMASFYIGESLYMSTPEPRLDQTQTVNSIAAFQEYMDIYPEAKLKDKAQQRLFELQDKLEERALFGGAVLQPRHLLRQLHQRRKQLRGLHHHGAKCYKRLSLQRNARRLRFAYNEKQVRTGTAERGGKEA